MACCSLSVCLAPTSGTASTVYGPPALYLRVASRFDVLSESQQRRELPTVNFTNDFAETELETPGVNWPSFC